MLRIVGVALDQHIPLSRAAKAVSQAGEGEASIDQTVGDGSTASGSAAEQATARCSRVEPLLPHPLSVH